ncbi:hypothetical protein LSUB1_G000710 [Lachnellula subtilissima]|uniref:Uncharacterized protein n=1 Tax=Lachnellula subtilissima TaxID=602034 RepID=A0A8H8S1W8_9HELO|nr:hypothetical protein LSUB1_G000710 [Lachnellula subtilissima]
MDNPPDAVDEVSSSPTPAPVEDPVSPTECPMDVPIESTKDDAELSDSPKKKGEKDDSKTKEQLWAEKQEQIPKVVDVKWLDFEHFKNRYNPKEGLEIIEVLRGHKQLPNEITKEQKQRKAVKNRNARSVRSKVNSGSTWVQRVRIQSPPIVLLLSRLTGHDDTWSINKPQVFFRPFRTFYYFLPQVKKCLRILEKRWGKANAEGSVENATAVERIQAKLDVEIKAELVIEEDANENDTGDISDPESEDGFALNDDVGPMDPEEAIAGEITDSVIALRNLRKYVQFVEENIMPDWEKAATNTHRRVRFLDLYMYFQPGELL